MDFEVEVAEFDDPSDPISEKNQIIEIDPEYRQMASDPDFGLDYKLEMFRRLESILKKDPSYESLVIDISWSSVTKTKLFYYDLYQAYNKS